MTNSMVAVLALTVAAYTQDELPREIWDQNFRSKRPAGSMPASDLRAHPRYSRSNKPAATKASATTVTKPIIGVTFWRLRPPSDADTDTPRLLVPLSPATSMSVRSKQNEFVAERLSPGAAVRRGDLLRLAVEVPRDGYLYIVDRERYRDGTTGEPFLIFPALEFNGGSNAVTPGRLVEIPSQSDTVPALHVIPRIEGHIGEDLLIIISSQPIPTLNPSKGPRPLPAELVQRFEREWGTSAERWDLVSTGLQTWTTSEKRAGSNTPRLLSPSDPMPQSIYSAATDNAAIVIRIPLDVR